MRVKAIFSLFPRTLASGKVVFYYQCYDAKGKRQYAKSTGFTKKTEANTYCIGLFRDGMLIPEQKAPTFAEFSAGWWDLETCRYLKWRQLHEPITISTVNLHKHGFEKHIKDYFAKYRLDEITPNVIENWLLSLTEKNLKPISVNTRYRTFKLMMGEALKLKLIKENPCIQVKDLKEDEAKREILTVEEVRKVLPHNWSAFGKAS
jgi:hypothetical protein